MDAEGEKSGKETHLTPDYVDEAPVVLNTALCAPSLLLLLILLLYLWGLATNLTCTSKRTVLLACQKKNNCCQLCGKRED